MANEQLIEELIALARRTADDTLLDIMPMVRGLLNDLAAALESCERERAAEDIIRKHRRQIEQSPGVGSEKQRYGIGVCDDILNDLENR